MANDFRYFVVLAGMRTGSNLLEERLNMMDGLTCYGEVFNPAFAGHAHKSELFGKSPADIAMSPESMIRTLQENTDGLPGFRLFRNHNDAALAICLADPQCAKIILRRNPVESYVSLRIVEQTDQWRMQDARRAKKARAVYDSADFRSYLTDTNRFYSDIATRLRTNGQTAFHLEYDDLNDPQVITGLGAYLGVAEPNARRKVATKKQNPEPLEQKVSNFQEMVDDVATLDPLALLHMPSFEPVRGPDVKAYVAHNNLPLLYAPVSGGPVAQVVEWMTRLNDAGDCLSEMNQRQMRMWKRDNPGHRGFTVLRHPVLRAWEAFRIHLIEDSPSTFNAIRNKLENQHDLPLPLVQDISQVSPKDLRQHFLRFLAFLKLNLNGQTVIRVDASWASQSAIVQGLTSFAALHDLILEDALADELTRLALNAGAKQAPAIAGGPATDLLKRVYNKEIEQATRDAYQRDYISFGFGDWSDRT